MSERYWVIIVVAGVGVALAGILNFLGPAALPNASTPQGPISKEAPMTLAAILEEAENLALGLWRDQGHLVREAVVFDEREEAHLFVFSEAASRDEAIRQLHDVTKDHPPHRIYHFYESSAVTSDGRSVDVLVVEVGDATLAKYGQRLFTASKEPKRISDKESSLDESPFAGLFR